MHHDRDCAEQTLKRIVQALLSMLREAEDRKATQDRLETCTVTYTHFLISHGDASSYHSSSLQSLFDSVFEQLEESFSIAATHAIQSLLWRMISDQTTTNTISWLRLLQHRLLHSCSDGNRSRIQRRAMLAHLAINDLITARQIYFEMSDNGQNEAFSQYVAFKVALRSDDLVWAASSLRGIARQVTADQALLYACALEAQQSLKQVFAIETLQALVNSTPLSDLTPSLLRCLARLMLTGLDTAEKPSAAAYEQVINLFDRFVECLESQAETSSTQWSNECKWWSRHAYNLGLRCNSSPMNAQLICLLKACIRIMEHMLLIEESSEHENTKMKIRNCHFVLISLLVTTAREQNHHESTLQQYVEARRYIDQYFQRSCNPQALPNDQAALQQAFQIRRYELEAIIKLKQWQDLQSTIAKCLTFDGENQWDKLADLALILHQELLAQASIEYSSHAPDVLELLQRSLNEMWKTQKDIKQVARWLRTTFSIDATINRGVDGDVQVMLKLLDQAAALASRGAQSLAERYPAEELQWLASASFNRGVDYGIGGREQIAWQIFDAALELARYANDNGALHATLTARRAEASKKMAQTM